MLRPLTDEDLLDAEVIAEIAGTLSEEELQKVIDIQFAEEEKREPGIIGLLGRYMIGQC